MWYKTAFEKLAGLNEDLLRILGGDPKRLAQVREICPESKFQTTAAYFLMQQVNIDQLAQYCRKLAELEHYKKLKSLFVSKSGVHLNDKIYNNWIPFTESIDELIPPPTFKQLHQQKYQPSENTSIAGGDNIEVHKAKNVVDACNLGKGMSWCVSQPGNTMYQSYRDMQASTFYFVIDYNREPSDPLHRVVVDMNEEGPLLTDINNTTGEIAEFGKDSQAYFDYLQQHGVDTSVFVNDPLTPEEQEEYEELEHKPEEMNADQRVEWFRILSLDYKSKFIGRGNKLSTPEFKVLLNLKNPELINQYLNMGHVLTPEELGLISSNNQYYKTYIRARRQVIKQAPEGIQELDAQIPELQDDVNALCKIAMEKYDEKNITFIKLPKIIRQNVEFARRAYKEGRAYYYELPEALKEDPDLALEACKNKKLFYYNMPAALKNNIDFCRKAFDLGAIGYRSLPKALQEDFDFCKKALEKDAVVYNDLPYIFRSNIDLARDLFYKGKADYYQLPLALQRDIEFSREAFKNKRANYNQLPKALKQDIEFSREAFRNKSAFYNDLPEALKQEILNERNNRLSAIRKIV